MRTALRPLMGPALGVAGIVLAMGTLAGCGGSDSDSDGGGMPTSASKEEFCGNFEDLASDLGSLDDSSTDMSKAVSTLQSAADKMAATGTPDGIPDDARNGLKVTLEAIQSLPDDATVDDISNLEDTLSDADQKDADAFDGYLEDTCGEIGS